MTQFLSKLLGSKQGVNQINEYSQRCGSSDDVVHTVLLLGCAGLKQPLCAVSKSEPVAGLGERPAANQKHASDGNVKQVEHRFIQFP
jgi:hypothetical protein